MGKRRRYTAEQITAALRAVDAGLSVEACCRKYGIAMQTYYRWRRQYGAMTPSEVQRLNELEAENRRLKGIVADLVLDKQMLQDVLRKKE